LSSDTKQARASIEPALRLGFANNPTLAYCRAFIDMREGAIQEAIQRVSSESWEAVEGQENYVPRALLLAQLYGLAGQPQQERNYYEAAAKVIMAKIKQQPEKAAYHSALGIAFAGLGRKQDAIREGKAGVDLKPVSKDAGGYYQVRVLAQIYAKTGADDEALRLIEYLLSNSRAGSYRSLRLDPEWKPLRNNPKFQALLRKYGG
jgi:predicted Zn-dependent protease